MYTIDYKPNYSKLFLPSENKNSYLSVKEIGHGYQIAGYDTGTLVRDTAAIHFLLSGSAIYNGMSIKAPCTFVMFPQEAARYIVDDDSDTFEVYWFEIAGNHLSQFLSDVGISKERTVLPCNYIDMFTDVLVALTTPESYEDIDDSLYMLSGLLKILSIYFHKCCESQSVHHSSYTDKLLSYIHTNYNASITEESLAKSVHLSTNYMHKIFCRDMHMTPIDYLNSHRIRCSKKMLIETNHSISQIAESVGFSSGNYFCRVFRKYNKGISPTAYRRKQRTTDNKKSSSY